MGNFENKYQLKVYEKNVEEADTKLIFYAVIEPKKKTSVVIQCDADNVLVVLIHHHSRRRIPGKVHMHAWSSHIKH